MLKAQKEPRLQGRVDLRRGVVADERFVRQALLKKGREIELVQMPRAEEDPAVAAASILAWATMKDSAPEPRAATKGNAIQSTSGMK